MSDRNEIIARLDQWLEVEYTFLDSAALTDKLLARPPEEQRLLLDWTRRIASTQIPLAYEFTTSVMTQMEVVDGELIESWALNAMDAYDRSGLQAAMTLVRDVDRFHHYRREREYGVWLGERQSVLRHFVHGLAGRKLDIEECEGAPWCDGETIFLPAVVIAFEDREKNFQLYKVMVALLWAQVRFGGLRCDLESLKLETFCTQERIRLEAHIAEELPGLYRHMVALKGDGSTPPYQFTIHPDAVAEKTTRRLEREKARFKVALNELLPGKTNEEKRRNAARLSHEQSQALNLELQLDGKPLSPPEGMKQLASSILIDFGEIPPDYLVPAGAGDYDPKLLGELEQDPDAVWQGTYHEEGATLYDEWDHGRQHYRKGWCAVREKPVAEVKDDFVDRTRAKYHAQIKQLRKSFEAMRDEDRLLKRQSDGDEVDLDALVEALADSQDGSEMSSRLFTRMHRSDRNIAVLFMVDMSGSTKGWINEAEKESLVLLCEALESLGDRYAIYGFSGMSRKRCEIYTVKTFDEGYNEAVRNRISGIEAKDYTRMGFAIRHLSKILNETEAKTRLLVTLSDGKPDDYSDYKGEYGIEDTRRALIEARRSGIHPYCITIDETARDYLPQMYGPAAYTVVEKVYELPQRVADIYRKLTH
ncbi:MAG: VWA domain-containing protein [Chromatiales bacterium]|nr:VWA domain-containing protein [Chromatiales bacterium]